MSSGGNAARLAALTQALMERWRQTRELWADAKAQEFEERFLRPLESAVDAGAIGVQQLESILNTIRSQCE